jgi:hypothetical protein
MPSVVHRAVQAQRPTAIAPQPGRIPHRKHRAETSASLALNASHPPKREPTTRSRRLGNREMADSPDASGSLA